jgi:protease secretion system membrane fusion protein
MAADTSANIAELIGNITRARRSILELRQRAVSRQQEYRKEVETQLGDVTRDVQSDAEKIVAVREDLARVDIKAPVAGQVVGLTVQSTGGVIQPGQKIMDVVPGGVPLLLEARVPPNLIDKVYAGLPVDIRFTAFAHSPQLVIDGQVTSVSGDLLTEQTPSGAVTYYLARVTVTPEGMKKLGKHVMQPGMPAEMVIRTGERTLLTYLLHPLTKRLAASMKEE